MTQQTPSRGFNDLGIAPEFLKILEQNNFTEPTPIQAKAIPAIIQGKDVMAAAQTGTGKTAGFTLPILELLLKGEPVRTRHVRTLVLTPTRELAAQVAQSVATYGKHISLRSAVVFGGIVTFSSNMRPFFFHSDFINPYVE